MSAIQALKHRARKLADAQRMLKQRCDECSRHYHVLTAQFHQLSADRAGLQQERDRLRAEGDSLSAQLQEFSVTRDALQAERDVLVTQVKELTSQRDTFEQERDRLRAESDSLSAQLQEFSVTRDALQAERDVLVTQVKELTSQSDTFEQERDHLRAEVDSLSAQLQKNILIRSVVKHGFRELNSLFSAQPALGGPRISREGIDRPSPRRLVKTLGSTASIDNNEDHRFAAKHAICHYASGSVCTFIPKNACTNLRYSLAVANGAIRGENDFHWIHANNSTFRAHGIKELLQAEYTFVILRNPFTRLVSFFLDKLAGKPSSSADASYRSSQDLFPSPTENLTFRSFVNHLWSNPETIYMDHHMRPQVDFLLYEEYDDWFCLEQYEDAVSRIKEKIALEIIDTRSLSGHTSGNLQTIKDRGFADISISELKDLKSKNQTPCPIALYDEEIAFKVNSLYFSDVQLYCSKFKSGSTIASWLSLSRHYICA